MPDDPKADSDHGGDVHEAPQNQLEEPASESQPDRALTGHLWGYLEHRGDALPRVEFRNEYPSYNVGRHLKWSNVVLPGRKVSNRHCEISWSGGDRVVVHDTSTNGTFINGSRIAKSQFRILRDGDELAFVTPIPQTDNGGLEDYRFIYHHMALEGKEDEDGKGDANKRPRYRMHSEWDDSDTDTILMAYNQLWG